MTERQQQQQQQQGPRGAYVHWTDVHKRIAVAKHKQGNHKPNKGFTNTVELLQLHFADEFTKLTVNTLKRWVDAAAAPARAPSGTRRGPKRQLPDNVFAAIKAYILQQTEIGVQVNGG